MRWCYLVVGLALGLCGYTSLAEAQVTTTANQFLAAPGWTFSFNHPNVNNGDAFNMNCVYATDANCFGFNQAACTSPGVKIDIAVTSQAATTNATATSVRAAVWLQTNTGECTYNPQQTDPNTVVVLGTSTLPLPPNSTFFRGASSSQAFAFPNDTGDSSYDTQQLMKAFPNVCDPDGGVQLTPLKMCFGADVNGDGIYGLPLSGATTVKDPVGWFQFPIDTLPPTAPTISEHKTLVSRVRLTLAYDDAQNDVYGIEVFSSSDPADLVNPDCLSWARASTHQATLDTSALGSVSLEVAGTNGVQYAYCARAVDYLKNYSKPSAIVFDSPHIESGLFELYPGELEVGYCGAALTPGWFIVPSLAWLLSRLLRERQRGRR